MPELSPDLWVEPTILAAVLAATASIVIAHQRRRLARLVPDGTVGSRLCGWLGRAQRSAPPILESDAEQDPAGRARELVEEGKRAARLGDRFGARQLFVAALEYAPQNEDAWLWLGAIAEDPDETVKCLETVLEINPGNPRALRGLQICRPDQPCGEQLTAVAA